MSGVTRADYWDSFYTQNEERRDWYLPTKRLLDELEGLIDAAKEPRVLHVGTGSSDLEFLLHARGVRRVASVDFSAQCIEAKQAFVAARREEDEGAFEGLEFYTMDVQELAFEDESFDVVLDKACYDCVRLFDGGWERAMRMLSEVYRVLKPGGRFILFSLNDTDVNLKYLERKELDWRIQHAVIDFAPLEFPEEKQTHLFLITKRGSAKQAAAEADA